MSNLLRLPYNRATQRSILASIERAAGLPSTDALDGSAAVYDDNPQAYMTRIDAALQYLRNRDPGGTVVLVAGVGTVADTTVLADTVAFTQRTTAGGTVGVEYVFAANAGVGFTITAKKADGTTETADTSTVAYFKIYPAQTAATPTASVDTGTYANDQVVTVATATAGAVILSTVDGSTPSSLTGVGTVTGSPVTITGTTVLKLLAAKPGLKDSAVLTKTYTLVVATPTALPVAGTYDNTQTVAISTTTTGAFIRYTLDGSTPSATVGTLYSGPVSVPTSATLKAIAYKTGYTTSSVLSAAYVLTAAAPVASPAAGSYDEAQEVTLSSATDGASIRYTVDGSTPSDSVGTLYTGGIIPVAASLTLKAIAYKTGYTNSSVLSAAYVIS